MSPVVRTVIFRILVPGFWTAAIPYWGLVRHGARPDFSLGRVPGWLLIAGGAAPYLACTFWAFAIHGDGTPLPIDPPRKLVVEGPYRVVRNPMYWAIVFRSVPSAELAAMYFLAATLFVLFYEEPSLRSELAAEYSRI